VGVLFIELYFSGIFGRGRSFPTDDSMRRAIVDQGIENIRIIV
jgi:hypothetical protein